MIYNLRSITKETIEKMCEKSIINYFKFIQFLLCSKKKLAYLYNSINFNCNQFVQFKVDSI